MWKDLTVDDDLLFSVEGTPVSFYEGQKVRICSCILGKWVEMEGTITWGMIDVLIAQASNVRVSRLTYYVIFDVQHGERILKSKVSLPAIVSLNESKLWVEESKECEPVPPVLTEFEKWWKSIAPEEIRARAVIKGVSLMVWEEAWKAAKEDELNQC